MEVSISQCKYLQPFPVLLQLRKIVKACFICLLVCETNKKKKQHRINMHEKIH